MQLRFVDWLMDRARALTSSRRAAPAVRSGTAQPPPRPESVHDLPLGFVRLDFGGGKGTVLDRDMYEYLYGVRHLPDPSQRDLTVMLHRATRVRVLSAGVRGGEVMQSSVLLETSDSSALRELASCLTIREEPESFGHCGCRGGPTVQLFAGDAHLATIGLQHGDAIRWKVWHHDAALRDGARLSTWLEQHGAYRPLLDMLYQNPLPWSGGLDRDATPVPLSRFHQQLLLVRILLRKSDHAAALARCDALLAEHHGVGSVYAMRSLVHQRSGNLEASLADSHKAVTLLSGKDRATGYERRASVYNELKRHEEAIADCSASLAIEPGSAQVLNFRGSLHMVLGHRAEALADLLAASELDPALADPQFNRAIVAMTLSDWATAADASTRAIALIRAGEMPDNNDLATMFGVRGAALEKLGDTAEAEADRREALVLNPSFDPGILAAQPAYRRASLPGDSGG